MKILICPGNNQTAKSYPYWDQLVTLLQKHEIKKIEGTLKIQDIVDLINWCDVWISIDSFLPHLATYHKLKRGIVLWGKSDPLIFGYEHNINLLKDRKYLRSDQFRWWMDQPHDPQVFVLPQEIIKSIDINVPI